MKFHIFRFLGISTLGFAALELVMIMRYWSRVESDLIRNFIIFLLIGAFLLSIETEKKNKSHVLTQKG